MADNMALAVGERDPSYSSCSGPGQVGTLTSLLEKMKKTLIKEKIIIEINTQGAEGWQHAAGHSRNARLSHGSS